MGGQTKNPTNVGLFVFNKINILICIPIHNSSYKISSLIRYFHFFIIMQIKIIDLVHSLFN